MKDDSFAASVTIKLNKYPHCFNFSRSHLTVQVLTDSIFILLLCYSTVSLLVGDASKQVLHCHHRHQCFKL